MKAAVVGAGIMGASTAAALAARGHTVTLFEQFQLGHDRGSSHGRSRIVRKSYPDAFYTACALRAYPLWAELQAGSELPTLHECGLLHFGLEDSPGVQAAIEALRRLDVRHRIFRPDTVASVFPQLRLAGDEIGVFTPEAGWVNAANALTATLARFKKAGGAIVENRRMEVEDLGQFDRFVVCAGGWVKDFVSVDVHVTLQTFAYIPVPEPVGGPVWIEDVPQGFYGFPSEPGVSSFKVGVHRPGRLISADSDDRKPSDADVEAIRRLALARFGVEAHEVEAKGCLYTNTPNEDFVLGRLGERGFFASPCSGHGFKFGPWIGKLMADFVEGKDAPENHPRFLAGGVGR